MTDEVTPTPHIDKIYMSGISSTLADPYHYELAVKCPHCLIQPCICTHRQAWLGTSQQARAKNSGIRKTKYKKFWSEMDACGRWRDPRYQRSKQQAMQDFVDDET